MSSVDRAGPSELIRSCLSPISDIRQEAQQILGVQSLEKQQDADTVHYSRLVASRRRDKPLLSCIHCRRRKSRCDRQQPCSNCVLRSQTCTYTDLPGVSVRLGPLAAQPSLQDRLAQLERLVMSMIPGSVQRSSADLTEPTSKHYLNDISSGNPQADEASECGSMHLSSSELRYVGGDHWAAILESIADIKNNVEQGEDLRLKESSDWFQDADCTNNSQIIKPVSAHTPLLYGCRPASSKAEILGSLPPKSTADRYISCYFNSFDLVSSSIHGPTFLHQYEEFWSNPSEAPIMWIGLLFAMMCLAAQTMGGSFTTQRYADGNDRSLQVQLYRERIAQCLILGEFTKCAPYTLETMNHYVYVEFMLRPDANQDAWFLFTLTMKIAMKTGHHRDPSHFSGLSPLQCEMRRRLWATLLLGDVLLSTQMGMPRIISEWQWDTAEPRNLNDADLDENTSELPQSRPETELTTTTGLIARRRILVILGTITDLTAAVKPCSYDQMMFVDVKLEKAAAQIPPPMRMRSMATSLTDSPQTITARLFISHLIYKGQIMLHRPFLRQQSGSTLPQKHRLHSTNTCIDASLHLLDIQKIFEEETCAGGQLHLMRWRVTSSMNHQFLIATMILCSLLHHQETLPRRQEIVEVLHKVRSIWIRRGTISEEAKEAAETVSRVLKRANEGHKFVMQPEVARNACEVEQVDGVETKWDYWIDMNGDSMTHDNMGFHQTLSWSFPLPNNVEVDSTVVDGI